MSHVGQIVEIAAFNLDMSTPPTPHAASMPDALRTCLMNLESVNVRDIETVAEGIIVELDKLAMLYSREHYSNIVSSVIERLRNIMFTHATKDKTLGVTIVQGIIAQLFDAWSEGKRPPDDVCVSALKSLLNDVLAQGHLYSPSVLSAAAKAFVRMCRINGTLCKDLEICCASVQDCTFSPWGFLFIVRFAFATWIKIDNHSAQTSNQSDKCSDGTSFNNSASNSDDTNKLGLEDSNLDEHFSSGTSSAKGEEVVGNCLKPVSNNVLQTCWNAFLMLMLHIDLDSKASLESKSESILYSSPSSPISTLSGHLQQSEFYLTKSIGSYLKIENLSGCCALKNVIANDSTTTCQADKGLFSPLAETKHLQPHYSTSQANSHKTAYALISILGRWKKDQLNLYTPRSSSFNSLRLATDAFRIVMHAIAKNNCDTNVVQGIFRHSLSSLLDNCSSTVHHQCLNILAHVTALVCTTRLFPNLAKMHFDDMCKILIHFREASVIVADLVALNPNKFVANYYLSAWIDSMVRGISDLAVGTIEITDTTDSLNESKISYLIAKIAISRPAVETLLNFELLSFDDSEQLLLALRKLLYLLAPVAKEDRTESILIQQLVVLIIECINLIASNVSSNTVIPVLRRTIDAILKACPLIPSVLNGLKTLCDIAPPINAQLHDFLIQSADSILTEISSVLHVVSSGKHTTNMSGTNGMIRDSQIKSKFQTVKLILQKFQLHYPFISRTQIPAALFLLATLPQVAIYYRLESVDLLISTLILSKSTEDYSQLYTCIEKILAFAQMVAVSNDSNDVVLGTKILECLNSDEVLNLLRFPSACMSLVAIAMSGLAFTVRMQALMVLKRLFLQQCKTDRIDDTSLAKILESAHAQNEISIDKGLPCAWSIADFEIYAQPLVEQFASELAVTAINSKGSDATILLGYIISDVLPNHILAPWIEPLIDIMNGQLKLLLGADGAGRSDFKSTIAVFKAIGRMAQVDAKHFESCAVSLVHITIRSWRDPSSAQKRLAALKFAKDILTFVNRAKYSIHDLHNMLSGIMKVLQFENVRPVRNEALTLLGVIGALDPKVVETYSNNIHSSINAEQPGIGTGLKNTLPSVLLQKETGKFANYNNVYTTVNNGIYAKTNDVAEPVDHLSHLASVNTIFNFQTPADSDALSLDEIVVRTVLKSLISIVYDKASSNTGSSTEQQASAVLAKAMAALIGVIKSRKDFKIVPYLQNIVGLMLFVVAKSNCHIFVPEFDAMTNHDTQMNADELLQSFGSGALVYKPSSRPNSAEKQTIFLINIITALILATGVSICSFASTLVNCISKYLSISLNAVQTCIAAVFCVRHLAQSVCGEYLAELRDVYGKVVELLRQSASEEYIDLTISAIECLRALGSSYRTAFVRAHLLALFEVAQGYANAKSYRSFVHIAVLVSVLDIANDASLDLERPLVTSIMSICLSVPSSQYQTSLNSSNIHGSESPEWSSAQIIFLLCRAVAQILRISESNLVALPLGATADNDLCIAITNALQYSILSSIQRHIGLEILLTNAMGRTSVLSSDIFNATSCTSKESWDFWLRSITLALIEHSPNPSLQSCTAVAKLHAPLCQDLLAPAFMCFWRNEGNITVPTNDAQRNAENAVLTSLQVDALTAIEEAFSTSFANLEVQHALIQMIEYLEKHDCVLPFDRLALGTYAMRCKAYPSALYHFELAYESPNLLSTDSQTDSADEDTSSDLVVECVESLLSVNSILGYPDAAAGILVSAQQIHGISVEESWYEKLHRWDEALAVYRSKWDTYGGLFGDLGDDIDKSTTASWHSRRTSISGSVAVRPDHSLSSVVTGHRSTASLPERNAMQLAITAENKSVLFGVIRCWHALGNWSALERLVGQVWPLLSEDTRASVAPVAASAAWSSSNWAFMETCTNHIPINSLDGALFRTVLAFRDQNYAEADRRLSVARELLDDSEIGTGLSRETYSRMYPSVVRLQMLSELEEQIDICESAHNGTDVKEQIYSNWDSRLDLCQASADVWLRILRVRSLMQPMQTMPLRWLKLASLCRRSKKVAASRSILLSLVGSPLDVSLDTAAALAISNCSGFNASISPAAPYGLLKHMWFTGEHENALVHLRSYISVLTNIVEKQRAASEYDSVILQSTCDNVNGNEPIASSSWNSVASISRLLARCYFKLGTWQQHFDNEPQHSIAAAPSHNENDETTYSLDYMYSLPSTASKGARTKMQQAEDCFLAATSYDRNWYKAWHSWALCHQEMASAFDQSGSKTPKRNPHTVSAIQGFIRAIALANNRGHALQDTLRLLTLWFRYGSTNSDVSAAVSDSIGAVPLKCWLHVIPQLIARIQVLSPSIRRTLHQLISEIGQKYPQALIFPLAVAAKSQSVTRRTIAISILDHMRAHAAILVEQALLVSNELVRVAITWEEAWYEGLEEASRLYYGDGNIDGMFAVLDPLHAQLQNVTGRKPVDFLEKSNTLSAQELAFIHEYGIDLDEAYEYCLRYRRDGDAAHLSAAWERYYSVFRSLGKIIPAMQTLDLKHVSSKLAEAQNLDLAIPGTSVLSVDLTADDVKGYNSSSLVSIVSFSREIDIISSKQRPRKITMLGSDGKEYKFLLKGHEDLRQDERVMQLFGLVNTILASDVETRKRNLSIARFPIIPLSQNTGLIGWIPDCDTLHELVRSYREPKGILLSAEHRAMLSFAPEFDRLPIIHRIEAFDHGLKSASDGRDLASIMWRRASTCESWLEARACYTRSTAVMSMVGYILGLGDRHPSNIMMERRTGRIVHIDFGDCFEVAMRRERFPEKVPFRLTRMMVLAMEAGGVNGSFRITSEHTMRVLRSSRDSVMAVLEAFIHDPLLNWRLFATQTTTSQSTSNPKHAAYGSHLAAEAKADSGNLLKPAAPTVSFAKKRQQDEYVRLEEESAHKPDNVHSGSLAIVARVYSKLTGRDFCAATDQKPVMEIVVPPKNLSEASGQDTIIHALANQSQHMPENAAVQVDRLIYAATSVENLSHAYVGWCAFW